MYRLAFALLLVPLAGCDLPEDDWGIVKAAWNDFPWWSVIWRLTLWTTLGAIVGLFVGIRLTRRLRRWGAYRLPWRRTRFGLQVVIYMLNILAMPILFGAIGLLEGTYRAGDAAVRWSVIGKQWLPQLTEIGADALRFADDWVERGDADWEEVRKNRRAINIVRLMDKLDRIDDGVAAKITGLAKEQILEEHPEWKDSGTEQAIDWVLRHLIRYLLNRRLQRQLADYGVPDVWEEMKREATKDGDELLTHAELTVFLSERVLIPLILYPLKTWATGKQWLLLAIIAAWFATPPLLMWLTRAIVFWCKRRQIRRVCVDRL